MNSDVKRVDKPWGYELHWALTDRYVGKVLHINAGEALSVQYHVKKDETIRVQSGKMLFEMGPRGAAQSARRNDPESWRLAGRELNPGDTVHVTPLTVHRMTAVEDCDVVEVSTPELDDVVRLEDRYGRNYNDRP